MSPRDHDLDLLVERALDAEAAAISAAPDAWERLQERLDDTTPAGSSPASRGWLLVAAAVVAGFGGLAAALAMLTGGDGEVRTASPSADAADDASSGTSLDGVSEGATPPRTALVVTEGGDLLRVDVATGRLETLAPSHGVPDGGGDVPGSEGEPDDGGTQGDRIDAAAVGLDHTVLLSTCCEPIAGQTYRLEAGDDRTLLAHGYNPTFSPDGTRFALVNPAGVTIHGLDGEEQHRIDAGGHAGSVMSVAWSPASSPASGQLAVEISMGPTEHRVLLVDADAASLDEATELTATAGTWWAHPVFRPDGSLLVAEHPQGQVDTDAGEGSAVRVVTPEGRPGGTIDLGGPAPLRLAADRSGRWVLVAAPTGQLLTIGPEGQVATVPLPSEEPVADVAW